MRCINCGRPLEKGIITQIERIKASLKCFESNKELFPIIYEEDIKRWAKIKFIKGKEKENR